MATSYSPDTETPAKAPEDTETPEPEAEGLASKLEDDAELVRYAQECYRIGVDASEQWRRDALQDLEFLAGEQWDPNVKGQRDAQGRPALTVNRLPQFLRQVTNEQRQSKPAITVNPVDSESDVRTAEVLQGIIRNIEYTSNADAAYAAGGQSAAATGIGYWDVAAEYDSERSFEQKLTIRRIKNALSVVMDPGAKEQAGDDARWVIISTDVSRAEWEATYPGKEMPRGNGGWMAPGDAPADWVAKDGVRVHEYRYISETQDTLYDVSDVDEAHKAALHHAGVDVSTGAILASEVGPQHAALLKSMKLPTRPTMCRKACFAKIAGSEVVERGELAGRYLQLVRVVGTELDINGVSIYEGVIRHAKDTQRMLNYFVSAEAEAIALAPKAPFIAAEGQIEDFEVEWETANQKPRAVLRYKPMTVAGVAVPAPQRAMAEANISAITEARAQAADDLKSVTGIYDAALGARSNEQTGRAILARQSQGQVANFHFQDNLAMAIRYTGRILIDLIPKIYSGPRVMRILGEDGTQDMVPVNGHPGTEDQPAVELDAGRYDVAVSMGQSYLSRRQEAVQQMLELLKVNPSISPVVMDLLVASMDIPGGDAIAERLKKLLPPQIRPPDEKQPPTQVLAQQLQQSQQMIQQLTQAVHAAHDKLDSKAEDYAAKERLALIQAQVELTKTAATLDAKAGMAMLDREAALIAARLKLDGISEPPGGEQGEEPNGGTGPVAAPGVGNPGLTAGRPAGRPGGAPGLPAGGLAIGGAPGGAGGIPGR